MPSLSTTPAARIVQVQLSFAANAGAGVSEYTLGPPLTLAICVPDTVHWIEYHGSLTVTGSLKLTASVADGATLLAPEPGVVATTDGVTSTGGVPSTEKLTSSMARPSSLPETFRSTQRIQIAADGARLSPVIDAAIAVRFAAALPSSLPATAEVLGELKSRVLTSIHVAAASLSEVAFVLYWKSSRSARPAAPRRHCSPV